MSYVDLLTHVLPGLDDGPVTMDQSVRMVQAAAAAGTDTLVSTPHARDVMLNASLDEARQLLADLNSRLRREAAGGAPSARVFAGMENHITPELPDRAEPGNALIINSSRFLVLSTPFRTFPSFVVEVIDRLRMKRLVPLLARPERNEVLRRDFGRMRELIETGALFIVTSGSISGQFGKQPQRTSLKMIQEDLIHAVASDMHSLEGTRTPSLRRAHRWLERAHDDALATRLLDLQPRMILQGHSPEAEFDESERPSRRRLSPLRLLRSGRG